MVIIPTFSITFGNIYAIVLLLLPVSYTTKVTAANLMSKFAEVTQTEHDLLVYMTNACTTS